MTLNDNRNFRLLYYEHLGLHNVEQKKALEQLLSEDPINKDKLKIFRYARLQALFETSKISYDSWNRVWSKDSEISGGLSWKFFSEFRAIFLTFSPFFIFLFIYLSTIMSDLQWGVRASFYNATYGVEVVVGYPTPPSWFVTICERTKGGTVWRLTTSCHHYEVIWG